MIALFSIYTAVDSCILMYVVNEYKKAIKQSLCGSTKGAMNQPECSTSWESFDLPEIIPSSLPLDFRADPETSKSTHRHQRPSECAVCGIAANGYHYDVPSCNGCKTFFRRMYIADKNLVCKLQKDCYDLKKRKAFLKCRACRYEKCISAGMNPMALEVINKASNSKNDEQIAKRERIVEEKEEEGEKSEKRLVRAIVSVKNKLQNLIDSLVYLEGKIEKFRHSAYNPHWTEVHGIEFLLNTQNRISLADKYGPMNDWPLPPPPGTPPSGPFRRENLMKPPPFSASRKHWLFFNLLSVVEYAKTFMFFHKLDNSDKLLLTKHVSLACSNLLCSFASVEKKFESIVHPDSTNQFSRHPDQFNASVMSVAPLIRYQVQKLEYLLLKAICLCNPAVPGLSKSAQTIISVEREKYADALFDHCLRNHRDGPSRFTNLISILEVLERQQRMQKDFHLLHITLLLRTCPADCIIQLIEDVMDS